MAKPSLDFGATAPRARRPGVRPFRVRRRRTDRYARPRSGASSARWSARSRASPALCPQRQHGRLRRLAESGPGWRGLCNPFGSGPAGLAGGRGLVEHPSRCCLGGKGSGEGSASRSGRRPRWVAERRPSGAWRRPDDPRGSPGVVLRMLRVGEVTHVGRRRARTAATMIRPSPIAVRPAGIQIRAAPRVPATRL